MSYLSRNEISERYGEGLVKFMEIRKQMDPDGIFKNYYLEALIGDASVPVGRTIIKKGQVANYNDEDEELSEAIEEEEELEGDASDGEDDSRKQVANPNDEDDEDIDESAEDLEGDERV
jgi:D-arabinono-1,4-lactone oxidase